MDNLQTVPSHFRPAPFWSWNDELEPEELRRQIREMKRAGLGGFFMHARSGLRTPYMGDKWMTCVKACIDEARQLGMDPWLYDENGWPSGFGGGLVNGQGPRFQQKYLRMRQLDACEAHSTDYTLGFYSADGTVFYGTSVPAECQGTVLECYYECNPYYVDNMDPVIVDSFLKCTHERYAEKLTAEEMSSIRGIFTDEPQLSRDGIPWSLVLPEAYQQAYQQDIHEKLPCLFIETGAFAQFRMRYWQLCAKLFAENFLKKIADWCEAHGWLLTGHHVLEETYFWQLTSNGTIMYQYQHYHIPGMDHLERSEASIVNMKQVTSAAAQTGKKQILSETFALTGWNLNMRGMKWMYQYQLAHGINFLCQHLAPYSMRGMRKRDYPLGSGYQVPWWDDYHTLNEGFGRVGMLMAEGTIQPDILVLHGQSTGWLLYNAQKSCDNIITRFSQSLENLSFALDACKADYHYGDETMMSEIGECTSQGLRIGKMTYKAVLIPQIANISATTLQLLKQLKAQGRAIYAVRNQLLPGFFFVDGLQPTSDQQALLDSFTWFDNEQAAAHAMAQLFSYPLVLENGQETAQIAVGRRHFDTLCGRKGTFYYLVNRRAETDCRCTIKLPGTGCVESIGMFDGAFSTVASRLEGDYQVFDWNFAAADSALFFIHDTESSVASALPAKSPLLEREIVPEVSLTTDGWNIIRTSPNLFPLERCEYRIDDGEWIADDVCVIHDTLLTQKRCCKLDMRFHFDCDEILPMQLGVETPENFSFMLNGQNFVPTVTDAYLFERSIHIVTMPEIRKGRNELQLTMNYYQGAEVFAMIERAKKFETEFNMRCFDTEVENIYLVGNFAVKGTGCQPILNTAPCLPWAVGYNLAVPTELWKAPFRITAQQNTVNIAELLAEGYPFFAGKISLKKEINLTASQLQNCKVLALPAIGVNSIAATINGVSLGSLFWAPYVLAIPDGILKEGLNTLELTLTTSLRNMFGPFHSVNGDNPSVSILSFNKVPNVIGWPAPDYQSDYCLVRQGIQSITLGHI